MTADFGERMVMPTHRGWHKGRHRWTRTCKTCGAKRHHACTWTDAEVKAMRKRAKDWARLFEDLTD